jgi:glycosyltransferase involved in cell wall biosynthesis
MPLVSISDRQRAPISNANFVATVYHGLPIDLHQPNFNPGGGYLAFLGRISPEKGVDRAIKVAQTVGIPLKSAAKVDRVGRSLFRRADRPFAQRARRAVHRRNQ